MKTTTIDLLAEAREFVAHVASMWKSEEARYQTAEYVQPAKRLRRDAERLEQRDAMIARARSLLLKIEEALHDPG